MDSCSSVPFVIITYSIVHYYLIKFNVRVRIKPLGYMADLHHVFVSLVLVLVYIRTNF